jgi:NADPH:quinone reductase-like Zn-dependent oxidoreductase
MDLLQVKGKSPPPPGASPIIGVEVAGTISALGDDCQLDFMLGEAVMALMTGGGYSEFVCVDERMVFRALPGIDMKVLASIPEAFITAYQLCFFVAQLKSGESALFHAASSSVGQAAIQLAVRKGIKVFATTRSENKAAICTDLGASYTTVVKSDCLFAEKIIRQNCGLPVNAVFDCVGESYMNENLNVILTNL